MMMMMISIITIIDGLIMCIFVFVYMYIGLCLMYGSGLIN